MHPRKPALLNTDSPRIEPAIAALLLLSRDRFTAEGVSSADMLSFTGKTPSIRAEAGMR